MRAPATLLGAPGSGQLAKMVNQICIAGLVQGLAEGLHFAKKAGLDIEKLIATISKGAAQSWQMENRYKTMTAGKFDFGFAVDWMRKDLDDLPRRGAPERRQPAGHRARRPVLCRSAEDGRQALGHVEPDRAAAAVRGSPDMTGHWRIVFASVTPWDREIGSEDDQRRS